MSEETHHDKRGTGTSDEVVASVPLPIMKTALAAGTALSEVPEGERNEPYVASVTFGWEGKSTEFALHPDEFGGYELVVLRKGPTAKPQPTEPDWP